LALNISILPRRQAIRFGECPQAKLLRARCVFELDERSIVNGFSIHPDVTIAHQRLRHVEPIRLAIHAHDLAAVMIGLDHVDEHLPVADEFDQRRAGGIAVGLGFLRCVDVLQAHVDVTSLGGANQKTVAIEDPADRAREVLLVGKCRN
jgi:hypothetical protein